VRDLVEAAFSSLDLDWRDHVVEDPALLRPAEVEKLCADSSKAHHDLGWRPEVGFEELIRMMVDADVQALSSSQATRESRRGPVPALETSEEARG
jgi:GDPmannose 4,6-dehydratase